MNQQLQMGKRKHNATGERKNVPKISSASKNIAAKRLEQLNPEGLPNFMREIKCQAREPLAPIGSSELENASSSNSSRLESRNIEINSDKNKNNNSDQDSQVAQRASEISVMMTKQPSIILDDNIFTFKPKVSTASARLVENLGTDFMTRQQQHLEKQKKFVSMRIQLILFHQITPNHLKIPQTPQTTFLYIHKMYLLTFLRLSY